MKSIAVGEVFEIYFDASKNRIYSVGKGIWFENTAKMYVKGLYAALRDARVNFTLVANMSEMLYTKPEVHAVLARALGILTSAGMVMSVIIPPNDKSVESDLCAIAKESVSPYHFSIDQNSADKWLDDFSGKVNYSFH